MIQQQPVIQLIKYLKIHIFEERNGNGESILNSIK